MGEIVFEVVQDTDGGYCAECLTENIVKRGDTWEDLRKIVLDAISAFISTTKSLDGFAFTWLERRF